MYVIIFIHLWLSVKSVCYKINPNIRMKNKPAAKSSSKGAQCTIDDSKSWIVSFQHFTA